MMTLLMFSFITSAGNVNTDTKVCDQDVASMETGHLTTFDFFIACW